MYHETKSVSNSWGNVHNGGKVWNSSFEQITSENMRGIKTNLHRKVSLYALTSSKDVL